MRLKALSRWKVWTLTGVLLGVSTLGWAKWEKEQVELESQLQQRIESILSKTLSPNSYLVTVKVELGETPGGTTRHSNTRGGNNPFLDKNRFVLPGVPEKKQFNTTPEVTEETTVENTPVEALVRKILITVLVAPDVTTEQIRSLREFLSSAIPFNPLRGDELDIHTSPLLKTSNPSVKSADPLAVQAPTLMDKFFDRTSLPLLIMLLVVAAGIFGLAAFLFGPVRGFFNRLLAVLPRVGEQAIYAANANNAAAATTETNASNNTASNGNSGFAGGDYNAPKLNMPFQFIREDQLGKLALLCHDLSAPQAALVLAYLPPAWASKLLSGLDAATQTAIMRELSQSREIPADVVNEVEAQIKEKLPYMVGGADWIQAIFPLTQPQTQRVLLGTLSQQSPELAKALRLKTFFFEDLGVLGPAALRVLVQDIGYPVLAQAMKDEKKELQDGVLKKLPAGIRDIVQQELDLSGVDKKTITDAKNRVVASARRLLAEGRLHMGAAPQ